MEGEGKNKEREIIGEERRGGKEGMKVTPKVFWRSCNAAGKNFR